MKILVDEIPKTGKGCLFKDYYNEKFNHTICGFHPSTVCALDCGLTCEYLKEYGDRHE